MVTGEPGAVEGAEVVKVEDGLEVVEVLVVVVEVGEVREEEVRRLVVEEGRWEELEPMVMGGWEG